MKKPPRKVALRKETLRVLANMELARAIGGGDSDAVKLADTGDKQCPAPAVVIPVK